MNNLQTPQEYKSILELLKYKFYPNAETTFTTVLEYIKEFELHEASIITGKRDHSNDYYDEIEQVIEIDGTVGISYWWVECIPHDETIVENWEFREEYVRIVKPVKVEVTEWQIP